MINIFQSTHPSWGATVSNAPFPVDFKFQSTHPSWGATWNSAPKFFNHFNFNPRTHRGVRLLISRYPSHHQQISIHAPIVGCDGTKCFVSLFSKISIHAPIVGCDVCRVRLCIFCTHISIHAPIVGCDTDDFSFLHRFEISIHAPIVGCDQKILVQHHGVFYFNPRTHRGVRHMRNDHFDRYNFISIHAPIVGCD